MQLKKLIRNRTAILALTIILFISISCNRYFDVSTKNQYPYTKNRFQCFKDSNVFYYNSSVGLKKDKEINYPKKFRIALPKKIAYYESFGGTSFAYYYDQNQIIAILIDIEKKNTTQDTMIMIESENHLNKLFPLFTFIGSNRSYNINNYRFEESRKSYIFYKGGDRILLLNIEDSKQSDFFKSVESFSIVE